MAEAMDEGKEELILFSTLSILQLIKDAQQTHGLRHGDYQRYRAYCSRRIRRIRKSLKFTHGHKSVPNHPAKFSQKKVTLDVITDPKHLLILLFSAERAWAQAMQLKQEATAEEAPRKRFHLLARLRKAVRHAADLDAAAKALPQVDAPTKLEASAYSAFIAACLHFEAGAWPAAMEKFTAAKTIYEKLSGVVTEAGRRELYGARVTEMGPQLRFCAYNIGDESAIADLMSMRLQIAEDGGGIGGDVERLLAATRERQDGASAGRVDWGGRVLDFSAPPRLLAFLTAHAQFKRDVVAGPAAAELLSLHERVLGECRDAIQAVRDEASKAEGSRLGPDAAVALSYLAFLRLSLSNARYLLMIQAARSEEGEGGRKARPQDLIRLYDTIIANIGELESLKDVVADAKMAKSLKQQGAYYSAFRCYSVAEAFAGQKKWAEAIALFGRASERISAATKVLKGASTSELGLGSLGELESAVKAGRQRASAGALLEASAAAGGAGGDASAGAYALPLSEDTDNWRRWAPADAVGKGAVPLSRLPPSFRAMPGKPLFFDLALNHVKFPNLEDNIEAPQAPAAKGAAGDKAKATGQPKDGEPGSGLTGMVSGVKGWFWGSK